MQKLLKPMRSLLTDSLPIGPEWTYEFVYEGIRTLLQVEDGTARLVDGDGRDLSRRFPELIADAQRHPQSNLILDGVIIDAHDDETPAMLIAFDLLQWRRRDFCPLPLVERRLALAECCENYALIQSSPVFMDGETMLRRCYDRQGIGLIAKAATSPYCSGRRSEAWLKLLTWQTETVYLWAFDAVNGHLFYRLDPDLPGAPSGVIKHGQGLAPELRGRLLEMTSKQTGRLRVLPMRIPCRVKHLGRCADGRLRRPRIVFT